MDFLDGDKEKINKNSVTIIILLQSISIEKRGRNMSRSSLRNYIFNFRFILNKRKHNNCGHQLT